MIEGFDNRSEQVFLSILDMVMKSIPAATDATIHLLGEEGERLLPQASSLYGTKVIEKLKMRVGKGIAGLAVQNAEVIYVPDVIEDPRFLQYESPPLFRSLMVVPLMVDGRAMGSISMTSERMNAFTLDHERLLNSLAKQAGIAIENAQLSGKAGEVEEAFTDQMEGIERILTGLQSRTQATFVLLADTSGQLISQAGPGGNLDSTIFSALAAGDVAATGEMAKQVGEKESFRFLLHEGDENNVYISYVGESFLLAVIVNKGVNIGLVRLFMRMAVRELAPPAEELEALQAQELIGVGFGGALAEEMEEAFGGV
ncbi:MAG: GAF domain-containing protein [Chloroflexota bacterium]|nr:GAF domain-containing protein [Chloroflexota bacterium]